MRKSVVIGGVLAVLVLSWAVAGTSEAAYKPEYKASIVVGPAGPWGEAAIRFADLLKERTQGRINVKNYHAGQLFAGRQTNEFTLLVQSVGDFAFGSTINWSPQVKELNLFAMPFMYPSYKALDAVQAGEPVPPAPTPIGRVSRYSELHKTSGRPENAPRGNAQRASNLLPERSP